MISDAASPPLTGAFDDYRAKGNKCFRKKDYDEALGHYMAGITAIIAAYRPDSSPTTAPHPPLFLKRHGAAYAPGSTAHSGFVVPAKPLPDEATDTLWADMQVFVKIASNTCTCLLNTHRYVECCTQAATFLTEFPLIPKAFGYIGMSLLAMYQRGFGDAGASEPPAEATTELCTADGRLVKPHEVLWEAHRHLTRALRLEPSLSSSLWSSLQQVEAAMERSREPNWVAPVPAGQSAIHVHPVAPDKGNGVFARVNAPPGSVLFFNHSFSIGYYTLASRHNAGPGQSNICLGCGIHAGLIQCPECSVAVFCSAACQTAYGSRHDDYECTLLTLLAAMNSGFDRGITLAMHVITTYSGLASRAPHHEQLAHLAQNADFKPDEAVLNFLKMLYNQWEKQLPPSQRGVMKSPTEKQLAHITCAIHTNGFQDAHSGCEHLFLGATPMMNHSCDPNVDPVPVALRPIVEGEEVVFDYCNDVFFLLLPSWRRREHMAEQYSFVCRCTRCVELDERDPFDLALRCTRTPITAKQEEALYQRVLRFFPSSVEGSTEQTTKPPPGDSDSYANLWKDLSDVCAPSHYLIQLFRCGHMKSGHSAAVAPQRRALLNELAHGPSGEKALLHPPLPFVFWESTDHNTVREKRALMRRPV